MSQPEIIDLTGIDHEEGYQSDYNPRAVLEPVITRIIDALGGVENGEYRMGEQAHACLKDLKKLWRRDDTDDDRTVARIFWERRLLQNDLVPILLATAGKGLADDKRAIACADLLTAMTWPIDMAEELKELDEVEDRGADFTHLLESHLHYKAALLAPGAINALFAIIVPPLSKALDERTERDSQIVTVVMYLIRNILFVKDLRPGANLSARQLEFTSLQSRLIQELSDANFIEFIITIAANTEKDPWLTGWNTIALEILYLLFRGVNPAFLTIDQKNQPREKLKRLLDTEARLKREVLSNPPSRHSRFGTTVTITLNPNKKKDANDADPRASKEFLIHRQQALKQEAGTIMDLKKRPRARKGNTVDELSREDNLSMEARVILQGLANEFLRACFNPFVSTLLKDIRLERARVTEKDKLRLLFVAKFFLEYFFAMQAKEQLDKQSGKEKLSFDFIAEVLERDWIIWVLKRMREAVDEKPKLWTELQAGIECLTQLLLLIDNMSRADIADPSLAESAELLQQQIIYNGDVLDIALDSLRSYREGSQSLAYLNSSVHLTYALMRILEKWTQGKGDSMYVRKKAVKRKKKSKGISEEEGIPDAEEEEHVELHEDTIQETLFTFDAFEMKFANAEINHTLLTYLGRFKEFESPDNMKRVVSLLHRQAVKAKAEGLFFNVSTLDLFKIILAEKDTLPRDQPYKDLNNLINYILRKFFKALEEDTFLAVEAFFPKNRGHWKQYSSWAPDKQPKKDKTVLDTRFPPEVRVKKGYSWSDQLGIAIAALVEAKQDDLVKWTIDILATVRDQRRKIIDDHEDHSQDEEDATIAKDRPSAEALEKIKDYLIPYLSDEQADAATKNSNLKLLFRLCKFAIMDEDEEELQWFIPAAILPSELQAMLSVIIQFLETPFDLAGKKASDLLTKQGKRRRRRAPSPDSGDDAVPEEDNPKRKRKEKKKKEKEQYKSAQFIEDSEEEYGDMDTFLEREKVLREKAALAGAASHPPNMKAHGTKKRRRKNISTSDKLDASLTSSSSSGSDDSSETEGTTSFERKNALRPPTDTPQAESVTPPLAPSRPKPRPVRKHLAPPPSAVESITVVVPIEGDDEPALVKKRVSSKKRLVLSDEED